MASSELINKLKKDTQRLGLYYNKYQYKLSVKMPLIQYFREVDSTEKYERRLDDQLSIWSGINVQPRVQKPIRELLGNTGYDSIEKFEIITNFRERQRILKNTKILVKFDTLDIYSTELDILEDLICKLKKFSVDYKIFFVDQIENYDREIVYLKNPQHSTRVYFKIVRLTYNEAKDLHDFFVQNEFRMSPSLDKSLLSSYSLYYGIKKNLILEHFFVDFSNEQLLTLMSLKYPKLIRKVCKIQKR